MATAGSFPAPRRAARPLADPGRNCWRVARAGRMALLVDGEEYFRALRDAILAARHSILMLGWEFDSRTRLVRGRGRSPEDEIGALLARVVRERPGLRANVLIWDTALIYAFSREFFGLVKMDWMTPRRLCFRLDDSHPLGASHHQKIVVVDDALAFVGGLDVSSQRWDSRAHAAGDALRCDPAAPSYPPFHDLMAMVTGEAAHALGDICRERWWRAEGRRLLPGRVGDAAALWPAWVAPRFRDIDLAIARTGPPWDNGAETREVETLYLDMIAAARHSIYIENQYFASRSIAAALEERLKAPDCPEVVIVTPGEPHSMMERSTMGVARARLYRRLLDHDPSGRLRLYHPVSEGQDVKVHAKLMIVDDAMLRVGSSNLNNRSMGLDTECDVMVEAADSPAARLAIADIRRDLMAEHLGATAQAVAEAEGDGLHVAIARLSGGPRTLVPLGPDDPSGVVRFFAESPMPDPEEPVETLVWIEESMPGPARRPLRLRIWALAAVLAGLTVLAALWRWAPWDWWRAAWPWLAEIARLKSLPETAVAVTLAFLVGGLARVPLSLLVLGAGALLGPLTGAGMALAGALASAGLLYGLGRLVGRARVRRLAGWKINRVHRALTRHGIMAILILRLMPVAAFSVINLVAGASRVPFRDFFLGSVMGLTPGILALSVVGDRLMAALHAPTAVNIALLGAAASVVVLAVFGLVERLARVRGRPASRGRGA